MGATLPIRPSRRLGFALSACLCGLVLLPSTACKDDDPPPRGFIRSVRIMATRADVPYAHPGETVNLEALTHDGRLPPEPGSGTPFEPMHVHWLPVPCINPLPAGQYYDCYSAFEAAYPLGVDLTPMLPEGTTTTLTIPSDALDRVRIVPGGPPEPAGTAFAFIIACAGHVERVPHDGHLGVNEPPFACFDANHVKLDNDHFEFGFRRVAIFKERRNANPVITDVTFRNLSVDRNAGISIGICKRDAWDYVELRACNQQWPFGVSFDDASAELDPDDIDANGNVGRETIFVDFFTTIGRFVDDRRILYDPFAGRPERDKTQYVPWQGPGKGTVWAVLHDNRGGVAWVTLPLTIE